MASSPQHEPTMEEILASIRKIISEDSPDGQPAPAAATPAAATPAPTHVEEADVLELTQEVHDEPASFAQAPVVTAPALKPADDIVFETVQEAPVSSAGQSNESIFSDRSRKAIDDAFAKLDAPEEQAPRPRASATPAFAPVDGNSVEAVFERAVRDAVGPHLDQWLNGRKDDLVTAMRPLIREWMDDHFPALLEGAVRDEVARVAKSRGR